MFANAPCSGFSPLGLLQDIVVAHVFGGSFHPTVVRAALAAFCNQSITVADRQLRELASRAIRQAAIKSGGDRDAALLQGRRLLTNLEQCQVC